MTDGSAELLRQFVPEARDLLEQAGRCLLALEREPGEAESMNALFRAVHTLKGTSGLFEIAPLTRVVHAAEDLLDAVQCGTLELMADTADILLDALDQVGIWIDGLDDHGALPPGAEAAAGVWVEKLRARSTSAKPSAVGRVSAAGSQPAWVMALSQADRDSCAPTAGEEATRLLAVCYTPDQNCFFRGDDPLALMRQMQGLRMVRMEPVEPWPPLAEFDPFLCNLTFRAITSAPPEELEHLFRYVRDQVQIDLLPPDWPSVSDNAPVLSSRDDVPLRAVLISQGRLLQAEGSPEAWSGHLGAASRALRGALRYAGCTSELDALDHAVAQARDIGGPAPLLAFIDRFLKIPLASEPVAPVIPTAPTAAETRTAPATTLRVEQGKIDALMNLIGELVVAKNALAYLGRRAEDGSLSVRELARQIKDRQALVHRIADELQAAVMAVRMLPVDHVFQRFPRLVRDTARRLDKQVELVLEGGETEADKNIIEALADPLIHMVRNSLDHGIEMPDERIKAGKAKYGTIRLQAMHENDQVVIRVTDDGRGIDPDAVRRKAVEKSIVDADRAATMTSEEATMLVFAPGFSTAAEVSDLSGRGVGMDVVRNAVEKAGGQVALSSRIGVGTTIEVTLPLSMAVTRIMTIAFGDRLFGVPLSHVVETVRVRRAALHRLRDREAFVLRDTVVPVVRLARLLDLPEIEADGAEEAILVVRLNGERLGIVVGAFREGMEVIVKPLEGIMAGLRGFSGTTLLGDGRVLLILDLRELVL